MTKPKPLTAQEVIERAVDLAEIQFDYHPTPTQRYRAFVKVRSMSNRKFAEDSYLITGIAIGWSASES